MKERFFVKKVKHICPFICILKYRFKYNSQMLSKGRKGREKKLECVCVYGGERERAHVWVSSVTRMTEVTFDSLWPHRLQHDKFPVHHQLPELAQMHVHRVGDAIQPSISLSSPLLLPSVFPSIHVFSKESVLCIRWPKYWSCSFSISPSNEYSGLISFRMDRLDLLAVQGTLKSLLQHHSSKASIFGTQLSL